MVEAIDCLIEKDCRGLTGANCFFSKKYTRQHKEKYANTKYGKKGGRALPGLVRKLKFPNNAI
jgi:hypothetical protein